MITFILQAILVLSGAQTMEELDEDTVERYESLRRHPVSINGASRNRLLSCGLFSPYQVASIIDYREHSGDILSFTELGLVDGIGDSVAEALREFITLDSRLPPGKKERLRIGGNATGRYGDNGYMTKGSIQWGERLEVAVSSKSKDIFNGSAAWYGNGKWRGKVVAGSFNARFGQGLTLWNGAFIGGLSSPDALCRRPTGISASSSTSTSSTFQGIATDMEYGRWSAAAMGWIKKDKNVLSISAALNAGWFGRNGQFSLTAALGANEQTVGADFRWHLRGLDFFGEAAFDIKGLSPATVLGIRGDPAYKVCWSVISRWYSPGFSGKWSSGARSGSKTSDEAGITAAGKIKWFSASADGAWHPTKNSFSAKITGTASPELRIGATNFIPSLRTSVRFRSADNSKWRTELRSENRISYGPWQCLLRADAVWCRDFAWHWMAEGGWKNGAVEIWLRGGLFRVDNWDDRIYVYERDLPGSFNVPARYGRGWTMSLVAGARLGQNIRHRLNLRAATVQHPWGDGKPAKYEWRIQYTVDW